jgi:hypothetical protein
MHGLSFDTKATRRTRAIKRPGSMFSNLAKIGTRCPTMAVRSEVPDARAQAVVVVVVVVVVQRLSAARQQLAVAPAHLVSRHGKSGHRSPHCRPDKYGLPGMASVLAHAQRYREPKR